MKCICPKCNCNFFQTKKEVIIEFIKNNPGCSFSDIHYDIRMSVKNVLCNCNNLEQEGKISIERYNKIKDGKKYGKVRCFLKKKLEEQD